MDNMKIENLDDAELVSMIIKGDKESFRLLHSKYFDSLIRFAWFRTHSIETSRDLVQDLFLKIWIKRNYLNPQKSIQAYLYKALNNSIINYIKLHSTKNIPIEDVHEKVIDQENIEIQLDIKKVLNSLPEKLQTVFILSRYENYKNTEIAEICGISVKAVEKRMTKTLKIFRKIFSGTR